MRKHPIIKQLAEERRASGKSLDDLADQIGRCNSLMQKCEYGARYPTFPVMMAWADALGFEVSLKKKDSLELDPSDKRNNKYEMTPPLKKVCLHCKKRFGPTVHVQKSDSKRRSVETRSRFEKRKFCADCKQYAQNYSP